MIEARKILLAARERGLHVLDEPSAKEVLSLYDISSPARRVVRSEKEWFGAKHLRAPYVLKAVSSQVVHKSDVGAVRIGLRDADEVAAAIMQMRDSLAARSLQVQNWLVEEMSPPGVECVIGGMHDPEFGPMIMVGLGGVFVEILRDVSFRICPIERADALQMVDELRGAPLLRGARGRPPVAVESLLQTLLAIGGENGLLMSLAGEIAEVDINPLMVTSEGALALDARLVLASAVAAAGETS